MTRYEKIGDTVFPVTYLDNGIVCIDYPDRLLIEKKNKLSDEQLNDLSNHLKSLREKYDIKIKL